MEPPLECLYVDGLLPEQIATIELRMRNPEFSEACFLSVSESLLGRVRADAEILRGLGVTHTQIAHRLGAIVRLARWLVRKRAETPEHQLRIQDLARRLWEGEDSSRIQELEITESAVLVGGRFSVTIVGYRGYQHCPFEYHEEVSGELIPGIPKQFSVTARSSCGFAWTDVMVSNLSTGTSIGFSELMVHLIRSHQFFGGEGLRYRLDPKEAVDTLGLTPGAEGNG